jgi:hypothetical protein
VHAICSTFKQQTASTSIQHSAASTIHQHPAISIQHPTSGSNIQSTRNLSFKLLNNWSLNLTAAASKQQPQANSIHQQTNSRNSQLPTANCGPAATSKQQPSLQATFYQK